jgi:hypothetical protein
VTWTRCSADVPEAWDAAMASCRAVQQASGAFHVRIDDVRSNLTVHRVIEGNAFGDLLPNLARRARRLRLADPPAARAC